VDHPLGPLDSVVRPWRTAAYVAAGIAAVELVLLLVIGGGALVEAASARLQLEARDHALAAPAASRRPTVRKPDPAPAAKLARSRTVVLVLNGNGRTGAAAAAASRVRHEGYRIGRVGNAARTDFSRSLVMYRPGFEGEGRRLAKDLGVTQVGPLDGMRAEQLGRAHAVFILGS
jgi:hypothetical protein